MKKTWLICLVLASFVCGCQSKKEGGGPVVNRDPTLSPQSPFSLLSFVILLGA